MGSTQNGSRGYSLTEVLVVVAIIGLTVMVAIPAILQLVPQYRIRAAAAEMNNTLKMTRQKAVATRRPWRVSFDVNTERYWVAVLSGANVETPAHWTPVDNRWVETNAIQWRGKTGADIRNGTNAFYDVDCVSGRDIIFLPNGRIYAPGNSDCGGGTNVFASGRPEVIMAVDNNIVRYNRYRMAANQAGQITITATKE